MKTSSLNDKASNDQLLDHYKNKLISVCERYTSEIGVVEPVSTLTTLLNNFMLTDGLTVDELVQNTANVLRVIDFITEVYTHAMNIELAKEYRPC